MKMIRTIFLFLALAAPTAVDAAGSEEDPVVEPDEAVVHLTNGEWPPYTSQDLPYHGFFSRIVTEALKLNGYFVKYDFYPWKRGYQLAAQGRADGSVAWAPTSEREREFYFSDPVFESHKVFFHLADREFEWDSLMDLARYRLGATSGYTYGAEFDRAWKAGELNLQEVTADVQNVKKLLLGRIDAFPLEITVGQSLIREYLPVEQQVRITYHPKPVMVTPFSVIISRKIPAARARAILAALNEGLQQMHALGIYRKISEEMLH